MPRRRPIKIPLAQDTTNTIEITEELSKNGIALKSPVVSNQLNGISNQSQTAIRALQVQGASYDNDQIYNKNDYVRVLINQGGRVYESIYRCKVDGTTKKSPVSGTSNTQDTSDPLKPYIIIYGGTITEDNPTNWEKVIMDNHLIKKSSTINANQMISIVGSANNPRGTLKVRGYASNAMKVTFDIVWGGLAFNEFRICNVAYSSDIKNTRPYSNYGGIFYSGIGIVVSSDTFYIGRGGGTIDTLEFDYQDVNFTPSLSSTTLTVNTSNKPYAIREGGGTNIQDLGIRYDTTKLNSSATNGCYEYWLFSNGFVAWNSAMTLDSNYFHQYNNGGFASLNIDPSDRYTANVGSTNGQTIGVQKDQSLPNIKGGVKINKRNSGASGGGGFDVTTSSPVTERTTLCGGSSPWKSDYLNWADRIGIDASRYSSIYKDGASVEGKRIVLKWVMRAY